MDVTVCRFTDAEGRAVGPRFPDGLHFHVEASLLGAGDVERRVAVGFVALDAGARATLFADVAGELPASGRDVLDTVDRLQEDGVGETNLRNGSKSYSVIRASS